MRGTKMLDLESDPALIELLKSRLRGLEFEVIDIAQQAADTGTPEVADRLGQILCDISRIQAIPDVMASRGRRP
jgi:hypothetical protein